MLFPVAVPVRREDVHVSYEIEPRESVKTETDHLLQVVKFNICRVNDIPIGTSELNMCPDRSVFPDVDEIVQVIWRIENLKGSEMKLGVATREIR